MFGSVASLAVAHSPWAPDYQWLGLAFTALFVALLVVALVGRIKARAKWPTITLATFLSLGVLYAFFFLVTLAFGKQEILAKISIVEKQKTVFVMSPGCFPPDCVEAFGEPHLNIYVQWLNLPWVTNVAHYEQCFFDSAEKTSVGISIKTHKIGSKCPNPITVTIR